MFVDESFVTTLTRVDDSEKSVDAKKLSVREVMGSKSMLRYWD